LPPLWLCCTGRSHHLSPPRPRRRRRLATHLVLCQMTVQPKLQFAHHLDVMAFCVQAQEDVIFFFTPKVEG
jgi:hypothetical protein